MPSHRVYFGKGDQVVRTIPYRGGSPVRVSAGTYTILDPRYSEGSDEHILVASTAVGLDAVNTTLSAKAGRGSGDRRALALASTAGMFAGRKYLLESTKGIVEEVRIVAIPSGTTALTAAEIKGEFPADSTLKGLEVSATFPEAAANDKDNLSRDRMPWLVEWTFTGFPPFRESVFLERGEENLLASLDDLAELDPHLSSVGGDRIDAALSLARAHKDFRTDLALAGADEADYLAGPIGRDAVVYRAAYLSLCHSNDESAVRRAEEYEKRYQEIRAALQVGTRKPGVTVLDKSEENATPANPANLFKPFGWS